MKERYKGIHRKPMGDGGLINGGFFVLSPKIFDFISGDATSKMVHLRN